MNNLNNLNTARRHFLQSSAGAGAGLVLTSMGASSGAWANDTLAQLWRREGGVLMIRHASTESGLGDPPEFALGQCQTQRNLSESGRQESRDMGRWMQAQPVKPDAVLSSQWCRCQDTARLAFGAYENWWPLNSTFAGQGDAKAQALAMRTRLRDLPPGRREVWVTHQVNMTALTEAYPAMGEAFLLDRQARLLARGRLS
jgi:phosphohistidine phosphatase SixA